MISLGAILYWLIILYQMYQSSHCLLLKCYNYENNLYNLQIRFAVMHWMMLCSLYTPNYSIMTGFHHSTPVLLLPFRRSRWVNSARITTYVSAVRITLLTWKIPLRRCRLPLRRNRRSVAIESNPIFLPFVGIRPISILITSSLCIRKDVFQQFGFRSDAKRQQ